MIGSRVDWESRYALTCCFQRGQDLARGEEECFVTGNLLSFATMFGLTVGSFGSLVWSAVD